MALTTLATALSLRTALTRPLAAVLSRSFVNKAETRPTPMPRGQYFYAVLPSGKTQHYTETVTTPTEFLRAIGREADTKMTAPETWEEFWRTTTPHGLRKAGLAVRDRRYILWCMEKYRQGLPIREFAHEAAGPKKIRGRGPKVQHGKLIRSRRKK